MTIQLSDAGKKFNREWIFKGLTHTFSSGNAYAITGPNGSGKSTLLQCLAASMNLSIGNCVWQSANHTLIDPELIFRQLSIAAPYLELVEEMTAVEFLTFHQSFKPFLPAITVTEIIAAIDLTKSANKQMRYFSSGMKQRVKLAQAIFADTPVLLLDEPCTNLDSNGYELYHQLIKTYCQHKLIIVSSNDLQEFIYCTTQINILDYK